jgi:hypothetical protein
MINKVFFGTTAAVISIMATAIVISNVYAEMVFNADALYLPALTFDLLENPLNINDWYLTPAPYIFPDMVVFYVTMFFLRDTFFSAAVFAGLQTVLLLVASYLIHRELIPSGPIRLTALLGLGSLELFTVAGLDPYLSLILSAHHTAALIASLFLVWLTYKLLAAGNRFSWPKLVILVLGCTAITVSDKLFLVWGIVPTLVATLIWAALSVEHLGNTMRVVIGLLIAAGLAALVPNIDVTISLVALPRNIAAFYEYMQVEYQHYPLHSVAIVAVLTSFFVLGGGILTLSVRRCIPVFVAADAGRSARCAYFISFLLASAAAGAFVPLLVVADVPAQRYFLPPFFLSFLFIFGMAWIVIPRRLALVGKVGLLTGIVVVIAGGLAQMSSWTMHTEFYPRDFQCIDRVAEAHSLRKVMAPYWIAKPINIFNRSGLIASQYSSDLGKLHWITNGSRFDERYDGAITRNDNGAGPGHVLDERKIAELNGEPELVETCGSYKVLGYPERKMLGATEERDDGPWQ